MEEIREYCKKDVSVAERQVFILSLLSDNPFGFTVDEITQRLNNWGVKVTKRSVARDIDDLSTSYAIVEEERNKKTFYKANKFNMKNVDLSVSDMIALSFMEKLIVPYKNSTIGKNAKQILDKLTQNIGNLNKGFINSLGENLLIVDEDVKDDYINPEIEEIIKAAIEKKMVVEIEYFNWQTKESDIRRIHPLGLIVIDKRMSVEAYCEMRDALRTFRLSRIKSIKTTEQSFDIPEGYSDRHEGQFMYLAGSQLCDLKIKFSGRTAEYIKEYEAARADRIVPVEDGIIYEKRTSVTDEVKRFVLSFGSEATVIEPAQFRDEITREIQRMYESVNL